MLSRRNVSAKGRRDERVMTTVGKARGTDKRSRGCLDNPPSPPKGIP